MYGLGIWIANHCSCPIRDLPSQILDFSAVAVHLYAIMVRIAVRNVSVVAGILHVDHQSVRYAAADCLSLQESDIGEGRRYLPTHFQLFVLQYFSFDGGFLSLSDAISDVGTQNVLSQFYFQFAWVIG